MATQIAIKGLPELLRRLDSELFAVPLRNFLNRATIAVQGRARPNTPVDTGGLRNRLLTKVDSAALPTWGKVGFLDANEGSSVWFQARAMEYGTGRQGDPEVLHSSSHFPPGGALDTWAHRHGWASGWAVAAAIARRGGLKPHRMLRDGLRDSMGQVRRALDMLQAEIRQQWEHK